jgi:tetratricopeptide (TPR) repeat protein
MTIYARHACAILTLAWLVAVGWTLSPAAQSAPPAAPVGRFDFAVRADLFAGFTGDTARFAKAMALCEETLKADPNHAEALVWHGSGLLFQGGQAFQSGDNAKGMELYGRGLGEMNRAVALAPDSVAVRVPRGATLFDATRYMPPAQAQALLKLALSDYERALAIQEPGLSKLSDHARGELLFGLAEGYARASDTERAKLFFARVVKEAPKSGRAGYSQAWLDGKPPAQVPRCTGCH